MKIYVRKIYPHDTTHEISVTTEIVKEFFDGNTSLNFIGKESNYSGIVTINSATDPRFGGIIKTLIEKEGGIEIDDLIIIEKKSNNYVLETVKKSDRRYATFFDMFMGKERHIVASIETDDKTDESDIFNKFNAWLTSFNNPDYTGKEQYSGYSRCLERLVEFMFENGIIDDDNLNELNLEKYKMYMEKYEKSDDAKNFDEKKLQYFAGRAALKKYINYIEFLINKRASFTDDESETNKKIESRTKGGLNRIYYGAPGCGKSRYVSNKIKDAGVNRDNVIRVTFHPEYANCDFIGQILPTVETIQNTDGTSKEIVKYIFNPGPLTLALKTAYNTSDMVYLIIEEINRGNAAAIFGDMFQLLDRVRDIDSENYSASEYPVCNPNMQKWLLGEVFDDEIKQTLKEGVFVPSNLTIFATMNSSDQNVFTLDTAFKRRWSFEQISNKFTDEDKKQRGLFVPGTDVTWESFLTKLNDKILENKIHNQTNEDKRLGKYFVTKDCLTENVENIADVQDIASAFAYKVFEYVWNDVCKIGREDWFDVEAYKTLENLIDAFLHPTEDKTPLSVFQNLF